MKFEILAIGELEPDFVSRRIQRYLGTDYSHIGILVDGLWLYHATGIGFHMVPLAAFLPGHAIRHRFAWELDRDTTQYALGWLEGCVGCEYSQSQYLGFLFPFLRPFVANGKSKTVCSEAGAQFMFDCLKVREPRLFACDWINPKDIVEICHGAKRAD
jgi:hypothetical protein